MRNDDTAPPAIEFSLSAAVAGAACGALASLALGTALPVVGWIPGLLANPLVGAALGFVRGGVSR